MAQAEAAAFTELHVAAVWDTTASAPDRDLTPEAQDVNRRMRLVRFVESA